MLCMFVHFSVFSHSVCFPHVYFTFYISDPRSLAEFCDALDDVALIIESLDSIDHIVFGGDLNSDLSRNLSQHIAPLRNLSHRFSLKFVLSTD